MDKEKSDQKNKTGFTGYLSDCSCSLYRVSLSGYQAPVYEAQAQTERDKDNGCPMEAKRQKARQKVLLIWQTESIKEQEPVILSEVTVAVTIKDKQITAIDILSSSDDTAFFNRAKAVIDRIIAGQTLDVDVVSGATFSSNGIISAVKNALTGEKTVERRENPSPEMQQHREVTLSLADVQDAAAYKDGTYYGTGTGFGGTLKVKVVRSAEERLRLLRLWRILDDSSYLNRAKALIGNIISSQSTNVDVISGATYSSNGIKSAVRDALHVELQ